MQIEERAVGQVVILDLKGKITLGEGDELLKDKINSLVNQGRRNIVLNFGDVPYIDSSGFGELVRVYTTVSRQGGKLVLLNLTKRIVDLLSITKLLTVFEIFDSESDAVRSFTIRALEISCPVCKPTTWTLYEGARFLLSCTQCDTRFSPSVSRETLAPLERGARTVTVPVKDLWWFTYYETDYGPEGVHLTLARPSTVTITGRLDLFAFDIVRIAWDAVPRPRKVVFDTTHVRIASPAGRARLNELCASADGSSAAILGQPTDRERAIAALGSLEQTAQSIDIAIRRRA